MMIQPDRLLPLLDLIHARGVDFEVAIIGGGLLPGLEDLGPLALAYQAAARPGSADPLKNAVIALTDGHGNRVVDFLGA